MSAMLDFCSDFDVIGIDDLAAQIVRNALASDAKLASTFGPDHVESLMFLPLIGGAITIPSIQVAPQVAQEEELPGRFNNLAQVVVRILFPADRDYVVQSGPPEAMTWDAMASPPAKSGIASIVRHVHRVLHKNRKLRVTKNGNPVDISNEITMSVSSLTPVLDADMTVLTYLIDVTAQFEIKVNRDGEILNWLRG